MTLILAILFLKLALSGTVVTIALLVFDSIAFHAGQAPEGYKIVGGLFILLSLIFYALSVILFIFS